MAALRSPMFFARERGPNGVTVVYRYRGLGSSTTHPRLLECRPSGASNPCGRSSSTSTVTDWRSRDHLVPDLGCGVVRTDQALLQSLVRILHLERIETE